MKYPLSKLVVLFFILCNVLFSQFIFALEYGQIVRIQCQRTGKYLSFDPNNDINNDKRIILSSEADNNSLWIIKGPLNGPVNQSNLYDRWNCVFGAQIPNNNYNARIEHLMTGFDAYFGNNNLQATDRIHPYYFNLGQTKIQDSSAIHYYNVVLNLNNTNKILLSNEYLCALDNNEAVLTQDIVVDTWNIIPVYIMNDNQRTQSGQNLLNSLLGPVVPSHPITETLSDQLIRDVQALINFYTNETSYSQAVKNAFTALIGEQDINNRINIINGLDSYTTNYLNQKTALFGSLAHSTISELIAHTSDLLIENQTRAVNLEQELITINNGLNTVGASSIADLTNKINQLVAGLNNLWE